MIDNSIGIDISKAHLNVYRLSDGAFAQFENTKQGFAASLFAKADIAVA